jgi:hypothetical protein
MASYNNYKMPAYMPSVEHNNCVNSDCSKLRRYAASGLRCLLPESNFFLFNQIDQVARQHHFHRIGRQ